ncbi:alpha/beta hydrolase [Blastococcus sp. LR1]|uniref:alpha/beta hydrolase n=1 Tax=Blastococcus sp. LR1 TaxID=2877000 RepID=UPI001CCE05CB|nr:alpha/beta hydrolase [Blastococcus sp. LR1]MCA0144542.1 alpha/beta hydrolase [Blastococcus sp. LR1]
MRTVVRTLVRPVLSDRVPVAVQRRWLDTVSAATPPAPGIDVRPGTLGGRPTEVMVPDSTPSTGEILYLHGGGFTNGSAATHRTLATYIAATSGAVVHLLDYRLAPEHPFPAALDDALAAYRELRERTDRPERTVLAGDSAGGWLALTAALRLRDEGSPLPAALALISPWLDLSGADRRDDLVDPMLQPAWMARCAAQFAPGRDLRAPELFPLAADLGGLPPMVVQVGSREILLGEAVRLAELARAAGVPVDLRRFDGMWHVFQVSAGSVRESTTAVTALGEALAAHLSAH